MHLHLISSKLYFFLLKVPKAPAQEIDIVDAIFQCLIKFEDHLLKLEWPVRVHYEIQHSYEGMQPGIQMFDTRSNMPVNEITLHVMVFEAHSINLVEVRLKLMFQDLFEIMTMQEQRDNYGTYDLKFNSI